MTEIDLQNKTRTELLELYTKHLGDEDLYKIADLNEVRFKVMEQISIYNGLKAKENFFKQMTPKDLKAACEKYGVEEFGPDISHDRIIGDLVLARDLDNLRSQLNAFHFSADYQRNDAENGTDIRANLAKLQMLNESKDSDSDSDSDVHIRLENQKIHTKNKIRRQYGLEDLPLMLHNSDLENLILLDNGIFGDTCKEFLDKCQQPEKQNYESRVRQIINLRHLEKEALARETLFLREANTTFNKLKVVPEKIVYKRGQPLISEIYATWFSDIKAFARKMSNKERAILSIGEKKEKHKEFYRILDAVSEILKKEQI